MPDLMKIKPDNVRVTSVLVNPRVLKLPLEALMGDLPSKPNFNLRREHASVGGSGLGVAP